MSIFRKKEPLPLSYRFEKKTVEEIAAAQEEGRDAHYHGGCHGCIFKPNNTSHQGIMHCLGCSYMQWDRRLPNLRVGLR